ncbi:alpha/beta hydrolase [Mycobacteroides abscessus]|uniref:alpha/beta hydrolase n=1 Tax=Mycobacteroides abscessus TaxID=36809 RepID=UPI001F27B606|nr:alpha/beta hydrolase [Mycobacteroides abscessus]
MKAALTKRGASAQEVADGLKQLPIIASWEGESGAAMKDSLDKLGKYLLDHSEEMDKLGKSLDKSANEVEIAKGALKSAIQKADSYYLDVDLATGAVKPTSTSLVMLGNETNVMLRVGEVQQDMKQAMNLANIADQDLASAVSGIGGAATGPAESRPNIYNALSQPLPSDPKEFRELWDQLTPTEKDWLYNKDHFIGNHPGMPFADKTRFNEQHLPELTHAAQANVDTLRAAHPDWLKGMPIDRGQIPAYEQWKNQLDAATAKLTGYQSVASAMQTKKGDPPRMLGLLDDKGHAAVSIGNPDTAKRVATLIPGTGQDLTMIDRAMDKSNRMFRSTFDADSSLKSGDVSVTTWMGYDRPMDLGEAASTSYAHRGAQGLDDFQAGLRASHEGPPSINTVIGHSYGSTLMGAAAIDGHHIDANNLVAVGSPGILADNAGQLSLDPGGRFFTSRAENDLIGVATNATLGPDPMSSRFGGTPFEAAPGPLGLYGLEKLGVPTIPGVDAPSLEAHSSYWSDGNPALANMGKIIAGQTDVTPPRFTP